MTAETIQKYIRDIPDFPKPGILFKDITPLLASPEGFDASLAGLEAIVRELKGEVLVGMESRGFLFGAALAARMGLPFVPARKPGKLPAETVSMEYELEYGTDTLEIHADGIEKGQRVVIVDDLIATGGTAAATGALIEKLGGIVAGYAFVIELAFLEGRKRLGDAPVQALLTY